MVGVYTIYYLHTIYYLLTLNYLLTVYFICSFTAVCPGFYRDVDGDCDLVGVPTPDRPRHPHPRARRGYHGQLQDGAGRHRHHTRCE